MISTSTRFICFGLAVFHGIGGVFATPDGAAAYHVPGRAFDQQDVLLPGAEFNQYKAACPDYKHYSAVPQYVSGSR